MARILGAGALIDGAGARLYPGKPISCHENSAYFCLDNPDCRAAMSGYALSEDGVWREHSWGVEKLSKGPRLVETTVPRLAYYGFLRTIDETQDLLVGNSSPPDPQYIDDVWKSLEDVMGPPKQSTAYPHP